MTDVNIFTLNCWGLGLGISKDRNQRMADIGSFLAAQNYDIVFLQEVWKHENFFTIRSLVEKVLPFSHYYDNGIIGTGTCIFAKVKLSDVTFHEFSLNGYPHKLAHGDWFGGKGLGVCQLDFQGYNIHIFTSHYHANYNYSKDEYLTHRVVHSVESALWIKLSSSSADLTIYAGDFNTEPKDIPYQIVKYVTPLSDAWLEANGPEGGETSETPQNYYTLSSALRASPKGKRIDFIMYMAGPNIKAETLSCSLPLPHRIPGKQMSYSDHEGVAAKIRLTEMEEKEAASVKSRDFKRAMSAKDAIPKKEVLHSAAQILEEGLRRARRTRILYLVFSIVCTLLLGLAFIPVHLVQDLDVLFFFIRLLLILGGFYFFLMSVLFIRKERHTLRSTLATLGNIYEYESEPIRSHALDIVEIAEVLRSGGSCPPASAAVHVMATVAEEEEPAVGPGGQDQLTRPLNSPSR